MLDQFNKQSREAKKEIRARGRERIFNKKIPLVLSRPQLYIYSHFSSLLASFPYHLHRYSLSSSRERIDPSTKSIPGFCNLNLNDWFRPGVIAPTQFLARLVGLEHILAIIGVGVLRPLKRTC